jgi:hypothetical protein
MTLSKVPFEDALFMTLATVDRLNDTLAAEMQNPGLLPNTRLAMLWLYNRPKRQKEIFDSDPSLGPLERALYEWKNLILELISTGIAKSQKDKTLLKVVRVLSYVGTMIIEGIAAEKDNKDLLSDMLTVHEVGKELAFAYIQQFINLDVHILSHLDYEQKQKYLSLMYAHKRITKKRPVNMEGYLSYLRSTAF